MTTKNGTSKYQGEYEYPFRIVDETGKFVRGFLSQEEAEASALERNARAKALGISATYIVVTKP